MEFNEIYCRNCKKTIGRYNRRFYPDDIMNEILNSNHGSHIKQGHQVEFRISRSRDPA